MSKKSAIIIIIGIVVLLLVSISYFSFVRQPKTLSVAMKAVPTDAFMLLEVKNYHHFTENLTQKNIFWESLLPTDVFKTLNDQLQYLDSAFSNFDDLDRLLKKHALLISYNVQGKSDVVSLYILELDNLFSDDAVHQYVKDNWGKNTQIQQRNYNGTKLYTVKSKKHSFSYTIYKGLLLYSSSSLLLQKSIRQIDSDESLMANTAFKKAYKTSGEHVDLNVYWQLSELHVLSGLVFDKKYKKSISKLTQFADWSEFDIDIDKSLIFANGFTISNDSLNNYLNIFKQQKSNEIEVTSILPSSTSTFLTLSLSDFSLFQKKYRYYLKRRGKDNNYQMWLDRWSNKYKLDIPKVLTDILDDEISLAYTQINELDLSKKTYFILKVDGESAAKEAFLPMLEQMANMQSKTVNDLKIKYQVTQDKEVDIYPFPETQFAYHLLGEAFSTAKTNYFTFIDNYLVFAGSVSDIENFIDDNERQAVLDKDADYNQLQDDISSSSIIYFYTNISLSKDLYKHWFNTAISTEIEQNNAIYKKFQVFVYQMNTEEGMLYSNALLKYNPIVKERPRTIWESKLDADLLGKPKIVTNHRNNQKEIFVQDAKNVISLCNKGGKPLWKINIGEPIMKEVQQVDCYKNNKLQYIFNTSTRLFIIDRNGNNIDHFPVNLRAEATAGIAVFDYDKSRDYRFFIPCKDKKIYLYDINGNILPGWQFGETEALVTTPIQHFRIKDKDYIVFSDKNRSYFLNRRGEEKIKTDKIVRTSTNNSFYLIYKKGKAYFITSTPTGDIVMIDEEGKVTTQKAFDLSPEHYFITAFLNNNDEPDYIFTDQGSLKILYDGKEKFDYDFDAKISQPLFFQFSNKNNKIGLTDYDNKQIYLFNSNGTLYKDFPLKGLTLFSISLMDNGGHHFNLITGGPDAYLYNYIVP